MIGRNYLFGFKPSKDRYKPLKEIDENFGVFGFKPSKDRYKPGSSSGAGGAGGKFQTLKGSLQTKMEP